MAELVNVSTEAYGCNGLGDVVSHKKESTPMPAKKPTPRIVSEVCTLCGLDWQLHGDDPTTETCIQLLAAEVRRLMAICDS